MHPDQQHVFENGEKITMMGDSILVRPDVPRDRSSSGLIHYAPGAMEDVLNTGEILAFGTRDLKKSGQRVPIPDLKRGLKCVFVRFIAEQDSNKAMQHVLPEKCIRLRTTDIIAVYDRADEASVLV